MKLFKLFEKVIQIPLYVIGLLIPKKRSAMIFGAWFGKSYADNSKHLFEYVLNNHPEYAAVWVTASAEVEQELRSQALPVCRMYSWRGFWTCARARYAFLSTGMFDINRFASGGTRKIQLWHGTPLKFIQDSYFKKKSGLRRMLKRIVQPYDCQRYAFVTAASAEVQRIFTGCFSNTRGVRVTGYPRTDILRSYRPANQIVYLPTHRGEGNNKILNVFKSFDAGRIESVFAEIDHRLIVKLHFYDCQALNRADTAHITFQKKNIDIYQLLSETAVLITDYSSVYFDFLLTGRPIIFTPFDLDDYRANDREMYYPYEDVTPGPKCRDWDEVLSQLRRLIVDKHDPFAEQRAATCRTFNAFNDFNACGRVIAEAVRE